MLRLKYPCFQMIMIALAAKKRLRNLGILLWIRSSFAQGVQCISMPWKTGVVFGQEAVVPNLWWVSWLRKLPNG